LNATLDVVFPSTYCVYKLALQVFVKRVEASH
jgi:hypothetical protein